MSLLESALDYASQGIPVFPCQEFGKAPLTQNGFKDASLNRSIIKQWWIDNPHANIGIPTGQISGITVVDVDDHIGFESLLGSNEKPDTLTVKTPRGIHYYFKYNPNLKQTTNFGFKGSGVDIRSDGGYIIAAPSQINNNLYEVTKNITPKEVPKWLLEVTPKKEVKSVESTGDVIEGGRNDYLTKMAGSLRKQALSEEGLISALLSINETTCNPPLNDSEVIRIAQSVARYEPEEDELPSSVIVPVSSMLDEMTDYLNNKDLVRGESTGIDGLDKLLGGGFRKGEVTALHAEAKTGKNTLLHKIMQLQLNNGVPQGYASRELSPATEVVPNLLSIELQTNVWLNPGETETYKPVLEKWPLVFAHGYGYFPEDQIVTWMKACKEQFGVEHFWFDHLHYMLEEPEDHKEASKLIKRIKTLAKKLNVHIGVIIQPNKLMDGQKLGLNTMKGGSAIGQAIDNLLTYVRVPGNKTVGKLTLDVARSKLAKLGELYLQYNTETTDLIEVEPTPEPEEESVLEPLPTAQPLYSISTLESRL